MTKTDKGRGFPDRFLIKKGHRTEWLLYRPDQMMPSPCVTFKWALKRYEELLLEERTKRTFEAVQRQVDKETAARVLQLFEGGKIRAGRGEPWG